MTFKIGYSFLLLLFSIHMPVLSSAGDDFVPPTDYVRSKLQQNDIVFLGTTHRKPKILHFIAELIPGLKEVGVTHIGMEIPSDQQEKIDHFMKTGDGLDNVQFHSQIDHPDYRYMFQVFRMNRGLKPIAIDFPHSKFKGKISRDEWMARSILAVFKKDQPAKMLMIVGSLHIFKKLEWQEHVPNKHLSIREYIKQENPSIRMWSVGQLIDRNKDECDFTKRFSPVPGAIALDLDDRYRGWKMGLTALIAILPSECFELVDGLIVY